jgi:NAD(P)-dependent dehydrogenase (short-subunit alcohol dehydrogenase family)
VKTLIVGATGDLGAALARRFDHRGDRLVLHGFRNTQRLDELDRDLEPVATISADLRDAGECTRLVAEASPASDPIDRLIVALGVNRIATPLADISDEDLDETVEVNLMAPMRLVRAAIPSIREQKGAIVLVSSIFGINAPANRCAYSVAKHGLIGLAQTVAKEEGKNIRINAICPGPMWSENVRHIFAAHAVRAGIDPEEYARQRMDAIPAGRFLDPEECAAVCWMLVSDDAAYINGQAIPVTGGAVT